VQKGENQSEICDETFEGFKQDDSDDDSDGSNFRNPLESPRIRISSSYSLMQKLEEEGKKLDNKYKSLLIVKTELENKKLQLEIRKLEKEIGS
jgi:hypothetical protein